MIRKFSLLLWICTIFFSINSYADQQAAINNGLAFLATEQSIDGSWSGNSQIIDNISTSLAAIDALSFLEQTNSAEYIDGALWLDNQSLKTTSHISARLSILSPAMPGKNLLLEYLNSFVYAWGGSDGYETNNLDTILALHALKNASEVDRNILLTVFDKLIQRQNTDGGWGFTSEAESNVYVTSQISVTLQSYNSDYSLSTLLPFSNAIEKATTFLLAQQNPDSGFGAPLSSVYETALAYMALAKRPVQGAILQGAGQYLLSKQEENGSWQNDPYQTALAIKAITLSQDVPANPNLCRITGRVMDGETGFALSGATISLEGNTSAVKTTIQDGSFTFTDLAEGGYTLRIAFSGYSSLVANTVLSPGQAIDLGNLNLLKSQSSTGTIYGGISNSETGDPLEGVAISVSGVIDPVYTDILGKYQIVNVETGHVILTASKPGYSTANAETNITAGSKMIFSPSLTPVLSQVTAVQGIVSSGETGGPLPGTIITITGSSISSTTTDSSGEYRIEGLQPGSITLIASLPGYDSVTATATIYENNILDFSPKLFTSSSANNTATIIGTVVDADSNTPLAGVTVHADFGNFSEDYISDMSGKFRIAGLTTYSGTLAFTYSGYSSRIYSFSLEPLSTLDMGDVAMGKQQTATTGTIQGTIRDSKTGAALDGVAISVTGVIDPVYSNLSGYYQIDNLDAGHVVIIASKDGYSTATAEADIIAGGILLFSPTLTPVSVPITALQGTIISNEFGEPLEGVAITLTGSTSATTSTDSNGSYSIEGLTPGEITIVATLSGYTSATATATVYPNSILIFSPKLSSSGTSSASIRGVVIDSVTQEPLSNVLILAQFGGNTDNYTTDADGNFNISQISGNSGTLTFSLPGFNSSSISFTLEPLSNLDLGKIPLRKQATNGIIQGTITAQITGEPIEGVAISVTGIDGPVYSDSVGNYTISNVDEGHITITAAKTGYSTATAETDIIAGGTLIFSPTLTPVAVSTTAVQGIVTSDETGEALEGALITLTGSTNASTTSEINGGYFIDGLSPGNITVTASLSGYKSVATTATVYENNIILFSPKLSASTSESDLASIAGIVVDAGTNQPLRDVEIAAEFPSYSGIHITDDSGRFNIANLADNKGALVFSCPGYQSTTLDLTIEPFSLLDIGQVRLRQENVEELLPDLTILSINKTGTYNNPRTLELTGNIVVEVSNEGTNAASTAAELMAFYDNNKNDIFEKDIDIILGKSVTTDDISVGSSQLVSITVKGQLPFRDAPIKAWVDSRQTVVETNEDNNIFNSSKACEYQPDIRTFEPVVKWHWQGSAIVPASNEVMMTPVVAQTSDDNGDGIIDLADTPDIIFISYSSSTLYSSGILRIVSGDDGTELVAITLPDLLVSNGSIPAIGDIDNDGLVEIVVPKHNPDKGIIVFENDGTLKWSISLPLSWYMIGGPSIADLDSDGEPEIIVGDIVLNNDGTIRWTGQGGYKVGGSYSGAYFSIVANIDNSGQPEVVVGSSAYDYQGNLLWINTSIGDGATAVGNFDDDPEAEIVVVSAGKVSLLNHDGSINWGPVYLPGGGSGGPPTIADMDSDGEPEIGVAGAGRYVVFETDGSVKWSVAISDYTSNITGSSVFDFDGNGEAEVVYADEYFLWVFKGSTGEVIFKLPNGSGTASEYPVIADVDNDGHAEIVIAANKYMGTPITGIRVLEDINDSWVNTRRIWNQHTYHITNINEDGTVPLIETNSWQSHNSYRLNAMIDDSATGVPDLSLSLLSATYNAVNQTTDLSVRLGNGGALSLRKQVKVSFYQGHPDWGGTLLGSIPVSTLPIDSYIEVQLEGIPDVAEDIGIYVIVDQDALIEECSLENNRIDIPSITGNPIAPVILNVETDKYSYHAQENVTSTVKINNLSTNYIAADLVINAEDSDGNLVEQIDSIPIYLLDPALVAGKHYRIPLILNNKGVGIEAVIDFDWVLAELGVANQYVDINDLILLELNEHSMSSEQKDISVEQMDTNTFKILSNVEREDYADIATRKFYLYFDVLSNATSLTPDVYKEISQKKHIGYSDENGNVYLLESNDDGTFTAPHHVGDLTEYPFYLWGLAIGDFNNDQFVDIVVASGATGGMSYLYLGASTGQYSSANRIEIGILDGSSYVMDQATADFNNDGNLDFIVSNNTNKLHLFMGNGDGTFAKTTLPDSSPYQYRGKTAADIDNDGFIDIIANDINGRLVSFRGNGDGSFAAPQQITGITLIANTYGLVAGDFNNDGITDILANRGSSGYTDFYQGTGSANFNPAIALPELSTGGFASFAAEDLNNDGNLDVVASTYSLRTIRYFPGNGDGTFSKGSVLATTTGNVFAIDIAKILPAVPVAIGTPELITPTSYTFTWNTGATLADTYQVHAYLQKNATPIAEARAPFEIVETGTEGTDAIGSKIVSDKIAYEPSSMATLTSPISNLSSNHIYQNLQARVSIKDSNGATLFSENLSVPLLAIGGATKLASYWNTATHPKGTYTAILEVIEDSDTLSISTTNFAILGSASTGAMVNGTINVLSNPVPSGADAVFNYSVVNNGNEDLVDCVSRVTIIDPATDELVTTSQSVVSPARGQSISGSYAMPTSGIETKTYMAALQVIPAGETVPKTLDSVIFTVEDRTPPLVVIQSPLSGSIQTGQFAVAVTATDDAGSIALVEYQKDDGPWQPLPANDQTTNMYSTPWEPTAGDEGIHTINFKATDNAGNTSLPVETTFEIVLETPFERLTGNLLASPASVYQGQTVACMYSLNNESNNDIQNVTVRILVKDFETDSLVKTLEANTTLPAHTISTGNLDMESLDLPPQSYTAVLQILRSDAGLSRELAETTFEVLPSIAIKHWIDTPANLLIWVNTKCQARSGHTQFDGRDTTTSSTESDYPNSNRSSGVDDSSLLNEATIEKADCENPCDAAAETEKIALLERIVTDSAYSYNIVYDRNDFEKEVRNTYYTDILILGDHQPLRRHFDKELHELVYSGTGLILSGWRSHKLFQHPETESILGIREIKFDWAHQPSTIELLNSPLAEPGEFTVSGKVAKVSSLADNATVAAWLEDTKRQSQSSSGTSEIINEETCHQIGRYPAIILNDYGIGRSVFMAFDLLGNLNDSNFDTLSDLLRRTIGYVHNAPDETDFRPYQFVQINHEIEPLGDVLDIQVTENFSDMLNIFDPETGSWISQSPWAKLLQLELGIPFTDAFFVFLPDQPDTYTVETEIGLKANGSSFKFSDNVTHISVSTSSETLLEEIFNQVNSLNVSQKERSLKKNVLKYLVNINNRMDARRQDFDRNILALLKATENLIQIRSVDISELRLSFDRLLRIEQGKFYFFE